MCDPFSLSKASYEDCYGLKVSLPIERIDKTSGARC